MYLDVPPTEEDGFTHSSSQRAVAKMCQISSKVHLTKWATSLQTVNSRKEHTYKSVTHFTCLTVQIRFFVRYNCSFNFDLLLNQHFKMQLWGKPTIDRSTIWIQLKSKALRSKERASHTQTLQSRCAGQMAWDEREENAENTYLLTATCCSVNIWILKYSL